MAEADQWFRQNKDVIYSGFDMVDTESESPTRQDGIRVVITGSTYSPENLRHLVQAIGQWITTGLNESIRPVKLIYAGGDSKNVTEAATAISDVCNFEDLEFLEANDLRSLQKSADVNLYLRFPGVYVFHHKIFELLVAGKPILCFPDEVAETREIVENVGGKLYSCASTSEIVNALEKIASSRHHPPDMNALGQYAWQKQVVVLENVLDKAISVSARRT
jgi:glycosyltransferase involved in cell wall biosynthesis